jgi:hypothetical protein
MLAVKKSVAQHAYNIYFSIEQHNLAKVTLAESIFP